MVVVVGMDFGNCIYGLKTNILEASCFIWGNNWKYIYKLNVRKHRWIFQYRFTRMKVYLLAIKRIMKLVRATWPKRNPPMIDIRTIPVDTKFPSPDWIWTLTIRSTKLNLTTLATFMVQSSIETYFDMLKRNWDKLALVNCEKLVKNGGKLTNFLL